jgi:SpoVK/Ycf46/Vps4 family AAA+-type ATPase
MTAEALAGALGRPLVELNLNMIFGGIVGASEGNMAAALARLRRIGNVVVVLDEVEKALGGMTQSAKSDGGVGERVAKDLLKFLENRPEGVYIVATCNNMDALPGEYVRPGRWDAIFFVGLPDATQRQTLIDFYSAKYGVSAKGVTPEILNDWTGAEIAGLASVASLLGVSMRKSIPFVIPVTRTMREKIDEIAQKWAPRCADANAEIDWDSDDDPVPPAPAPGPAKGRKIAGPGLWGPGNAN